MPAVSAVTKAPIELENTVRLFLGDGSWLYSPRMNGVESRISLACRPVGELSSYCLSE